MKLKKHLKVSNLVLVTKEDKITHPKVMEDNMKQVPTLPILTTLIITVKWENKRSKKTCKAR